ncbi:MAG: hypothetical protein GF353_18330 [Candidatus Lokiarchaeota archaeon]|nr:hypothetical protein [Candidatus Lokiarchaeota archaeon]
MTREAFNKKLYNLLLISVGFFFISVGFVGNYVLSFSVIFEEIFVSTGFVLVVLFTNITFHRNRGTKTNLILLVEVFLALIMICFQIIIRFYVYNPAIYYARLFVDILFTFLTFGYLGISALFVYKSLEDGQIQPWIIVRYKIISYVSIILSFHAIPQILIPWDVGTDDLTNFFTLLSYTIIMVQAVVFSIGFCIAWMMPKNLKKYFNSSYDTPQELELSEEALLKKIKIELEQKNKGPNN